MRLSVWPSFPGVGFAQVLVPLDGLSWLFGPLSCFDLSFLSPFFFWFFAIIKRKSKNPHIQISPQSPPCRDPPRQPQHFTMVGLFSRLNLFFVTVAPCALPSPHSVPLTYPPNCPPDPKHFHPFSLLFVPRPLEPPKKLVPTRLRKQSPLFPPL